MSRLEKIRDSESERYCWSFKNELIQILNKLVKPDMCILEVGCGRGEDLTLFSRVKIIVGLDVSEVALKMARKKPERRFHLICGSAEDLPFKRDSVDIVIASEVIEHLPNPRKFVSQASEVLRDSGRVMITTPNKYSAWYIPLYYFLSKKVRHWIFKNLVVNKIRGKREIEKKEVLEEKYRIREHEHIFSPGELNKLLQSKGFKIEAMRGGRLDLIMISELFDKSNLFRQIWSTLDHIIDFIPKNHYLKWTLIVHARKGCG